MKTKTIIGKVYANWCGHCQALKPEWNKMKSLINKDANIEIVEIEENENEKLNKLKERFPELQINGYPTVFKIHPNKQIEYYTGNRLSFDMKKWATEKNKTIKNRKSVKNAFVKNAFVKNAFVKNAFVKNRKYIKNTNKNKTKKLFNIFSF
jgi:thiol-disulfide isomerase/thioredoxin